MLYTSSNYLVESWVFHMLAYESDAKRWRGDPFSSRKVIILLRPYTAKPNPWVCLRGHHASHLFTPEPKTRQKSSPICLTSCKYLSMWVPSLRFTILLSPTTPIGLPVRWELIHPQSSGENQTSPRQQTHTTSGEVFGEPKSSPHFPPHILIYEGVHCWTKVCNLHYRL